MIPAPGRSEPGSSALVVSSLSKRYGTTRALNEVSFVVPSGVVHGLVGGNGSGKSTLIKSLAGVVRPDTGTVTIRGDVIDLAAGIGASRMRESGLRFVHQQSSVFADLTVAENLALGSGFATSSFGRIRWREQNIRAQAIVDRFDIQARPSDRVGNMRPAVQATLAIARALSDLAEGESGVLVLDEPTASLPPAEVSMLLDAMQSYAATGHSIIFVSHRLEEILSVTSSLTVLRDGVVNADSRTADLTHDDLVELIAGGQIKESVSISPVSETPPPLEGSLIVDSLRGAGLRHASFTVRRGEVVGVAGLLGSGRSSLLRLLFGVTPKTGGSIRLDGQEVVIDNVGDAMSSGFAMVPEDRASEAVFADLTVDENLSIASSGEYWRGGRLHLRQQRRDSERLIRDYGIKAPGARVKLSSLSGGNQQKVILARWIRRQPSVLLLDEPTHGVDVGARTAIYEVIRAAAAQGACVLVVSSDAEELESLCDRVMVLRDGYLAETLDTNETTDIDLEGVV